MRRNYELQEQQQLQEEQAKQLAANDDVKVVQNDDKLDLCYERSSPDADTAAAATKSPGFVVMSSQFCDDGTRLIQCCSSTPYPIAT